MRMLPLLADLIHARDCKPICEKLLTLPKIILTKKSVPEFLAKIPERFFINKNSVRNIPDTGKYDSQKVPCTSWLIFLEWSATRFILISSSSITKPATGSQRFSLRRTI